MGAKMVNSLVPPLYHFNGNNPPVGYRREVIIVFT
jgi:hypothetical protein